MPAMELIGNMMDCFQTVDDTECKPIAPLIESGNALNANPERLRVIFENILASTMFYSLVGLVLPPVKKAVLQMDGTDVG